ncbi:MAG: tape measure protein [Pseudomonadota bacterium]
MKLSLILEAKDRASRLVERVQRGVTGLRQRGITPLGRAMQNVDRVGSRFLTNLPTRLSALAVRVRAVAGRWGMGALRIGALGAAAAIGTTIRMVATLAALTAGLAAFGAGFAASWATAGVVKVGAQFEQFRVVLENTEGSAQKAQAAMDWVKTFARQTPYEIGDVMQAFVALKAYGIDPTNGALTALGNAASGMGKPLMQAIEMLADAQTGEFERLKEFGVRASQQGNKVTFTYMRAGKEVTRTANKSAADIQKALIGIFDERFKGMMDRQSRTLAGLWSNLMDMLTNFQLTIADAGFFDAIKAKLQSVLDLVNKWAADGTLQRAAERISTLLTDITNKAYDFVTKTDWNAVVTGIGAIATALVNVIGLIGRAATEFGKLTARFDRNASLQISRGWFTSAAQKRAARDRVRAANRELGRPENDGIDPADVEADKRSDAAAGEARRYERRARDNERRGTPGFRPGDLRLPLKPDKISLDVHLTGPGAQQASVRRIQASGDGIDASVYRGRAMTGALV